MGIRLKPWQGAKSPHCSISYYYLLIIHIIHCIINFTPGVKCNVNSHNSGKTCRATEPEQRRHLRIRFIAWLHYRRKLNSPACSSWILCKVTLVGLESGAIYAISAASDQVNFLCVKSQNKMNTTRAESSINKKDHDSTVRDNKMKCIQNLWVWPPESVNWHIFPRLWKSVCLCLWKFLWVWKTDVRPIDCKKKEEENGDQEQK